MLDLIGLRGQVAVGFFGTSGFVVYGNVSNPYGFLDERTLDAMGVLGMDDYPSSPSGMATDLASYEALYGPFPLMLTRVGDDQRDDRRRPLIRRHHRHGDPGRQALLLRPELLDHHRRRGQRQRANQ